MIRRLLVAVVVSLCVVCSGTLTAASKGSGSHASGHGTRASSGDKGRSSSKSAHAKASKKDDGTKAKGHAEKAPASSTAARDARGRIQRSAAARHAPPPSRRPAM
jgi:hypothetical protein